ncbi:hypothetical protein pb186bvf_004193 [Paramecium bursaria]
MYSDECGEVYEVGSESMSDGLDQHNGQTSEQQKEEGLLDELDYGQVEKRVEDQDSKIQVIQYNYDEMYEGLFQNVELQQYKDNKNKIRQNLDKYRQTVCSSQDIKKSIIRELNYSQHNYIDIIRKCLLDYQKSIIQSSEYELKIIVEQSPRLPASYQNYVFESDLPTYVYYNPDKLFFTIGRESTAGNYTCNFCAKPHKLIINEVQLKSEVLQFIHILVDYSQLSIQGNIQRNQLKLQELFRKNKKSVISFQSIRKICAKQLDKKKKLRIQDVTQHSQQLLLKISSDEYEYQEGSEIKQFDEFQIGSQAIMIIKNTYGSFKLFLEKQDEKKNYYDQEDLVNYIHRTLSGLQVKIKFISSYPNIDELLQQICSKTLDLNTMNLKLEQTPQLLEQLLQIYTHSTLVVQIKKDTHPIQFFALLGHKETSNVFLFGRGDLNTIRFDGNQVSRCHGEIRYLGNNQWRIVDGGKSQAQEQWTCSTMGTWKFLKQKTFYHIDNLQILRYGSQLIRFDLFTNQKQQCTTEQIFKYELDDLR